MSPLPVDVLERDWQRELHGPLLSSRFRAWREVEPALSRFKDAAALLRFFRGPGPNADKDAALCALLVLARGEPIAGRVVMEAMLPGLKKLAGRTLVDAREREELWSALMACAWERIRSYPVERRPRKVAANLLLDCLRGTLAGLTSARRPSQLASFAALGELESPRNCEVDGDVDALLAQATTAGALTHDEAELILTTRIDGTSLGELARSRGLSFDTLKHRRQRAERRLLFFLGRPVPQGGARRPFSAARVAG
jgi:DNA-directed RNA polymerase specialized sigma24 family protein